MTEKKYHIGSCCSCLLFNVMCEIYELDALFSSIKQVNDNVYLQDDAMIVFS